MSNHETGIRSIVFALYLLLIFSLGFMKPSLDVGFAALTPTDLIFPLVFICWLVALVGGVCRFKWRPEFWTFAFYFLALVISSIFSVNPRLSVARLPGAAYLILLAVITANIVTSFNHLRLSFLGWLAGAIIPLVVALIGIFLFYLAPGNTLLADLTYHYGAVPVGNFPRISSTFISASMFCNYLTVTLILILASARMGWIGIVSAGALTAALGVCALFTISIALGGIVLAAGLWLTITYSKNRVGYFSLAVSCAIAIAFLLIAPFALSVQPEPSFVGIPGPSSRFLVWSDALTTFLSDPLTGNGLGTAVANVTFQNYDGTWSLLTDAHNLFLSVAAQSGVLGLIGIAGIAVAALKAARVKSDGKEKAYIQRCLAITFFTAFVYEGLTSSFEDARHLWILIGLILAAKSADGDTRESRSLHRA